MGIPSIINIGGIARYEREERGNGVTNGNR